MKKLYGLFFSYREVNLLIAYSNKKKKIKRYLYETLHLDDEVLSYFSFNDITQEWLEGIDHWDKIELIEEMGVIMPSIEWEIIHKDYDFYRTGFRSRFDNIIMPFIYVLDEDGINHWNEIMKRINSYSDKEFEDRLYSGFIHFHALMNNDGTIQAFINRLEMINSFREGKLLDSECDMYSDLYYT